MKIFIHAIQVDIKLKACMVCIGLLENRHAVKLCVKYWVNHTVPL